MNLKQLAQGAIWLTKLPTNLTFGYSDIPVRTESSWEEEKNDILERANWLCEKIIVKPEQLIKQMPSLLGEEYAGQWAIYCCSMLAHALANISRIYPDKKEQCPDLIARLIEIVDTPAIRKYDTIEWKEDAMDTLDGPKSHMTYLSILAWMITNYKFTGGDNRFDNLLHTLCKTLNRRMLESKYDLNLLSFPYKPIFLPDMLVAIIALRNYARLYDGTYQDTVDKWLDNAKTKWVHKGTGLLHSMLPGASRYKSSRPLRGSYVALNCSYLALVDETFAFEQHERMKAIMTKEATILGKTFFGIKEYMKKSPQFAFAGGDAGLVIEGLSAGGTAFALGSSTYFEDWEFRSKLLRTAEMAGGTTQSKGKRCYRLGEIFITGEATALAMRTNVKLPLS